MLREHLSRFSVTKQVTVKFGRRLLGLLAAAAEAVPLGLLHMRPLQQWFARCWECVLVYGVPETRVSF